MGETAIAIIGFGKIAQDQHLPAIASNPAFRLVAAVSPAGGDAGCPMFADHVEMLRHVRPDAVAICTPPGPRYRIARYCIEAGVHTLLEKPPCASLGEIEDLAAFGARKKICLFTTWHAQYNEAVRRASALVTKDGLRSLHINWLEDVEKWHPGQQWIWKPGGFGVFDAGVNALSIATLLAPGPLLLQAAQLVLRAGEQQPIAATLDLACADAAGPIDVHLDWRRKGHEVWTIDGITAAGQSFRLIDGGKSLEIAGRLEVAGTDSEYPAIYEAFARLLVERASHVDAEPLRLVADAFLKADRVINGPDPG